MADTGFNWTSLIEPGLALGGSLLGKKLDQNAARDLTEYQTKESARQFDLGRSDDLAKIARSNQIRQMIAPGMFTHLGYSPEQGKQMAAKLGSANAPLMGTPGFNPSSPLPGSPSNPALATPKPSMGGTLAKAGVGTGLGMAAPAIAKAIGIGGAGLGGSLATSAFTFGLPAAAMLGTKLWENSQAHRQADKLTGEGGMQYNLNKQLEELANYVKNGQMSQEEADVYRQQAYKQTADQALQFAAGNGDKTQVVRQMLGGYGEWDPALKALSQQYLSMPELQQRSMFGAR
jgi:hypothetical protein